MTCEYYNNCFLRNLAEENRISNKWKEEYCKFNNNWLNYVRCQMEEENKFHLDNMILDESFVNIKNEK